MAKYRIPFSVWAGGTIDVETDETDPEVIVELAYDEGVHGLCVQCSGGKYVYRNTSLELGDEMEVQRDDDGPIIYLADGDRYKP